MSKRRALKLVLEEGGEVQELAFESQESVTIGRTADNAVRITDALSSRHHCKISPSGAGFQVEDLKSRNGTRLNGEPLTEPTLLSPGDRIEVGDSIVHFEQRQRAAATQGARRKGEPLRTSDEPRLVAIKGQTQGTVELSTLPFVIGRKKGSGLVPADEDVSNEHCMIVEDGDVLHLVDLGSTNGTFLDGSRLRGRAPLVHGAIVRLGATLELCAEAGSKGSARVARKGSARVARKGSARVSKRRARTSARAAEPTPESVDEIDDLDSLDAASAEPGQRAPVPPTVGEAPPRVPPAIEPPIPSTVAAEELGESDLIELDIGARLDAAASEAGARGGAGGLGAAMLVGMLLLVALSVAYAGRGLLSRPLPDPRVGENLIENWSFEHEVAKDGSIPAWEILASSSTLVGGAQARHGLRALAVPILPDAGGPQVKSAPVRVTAGKRYRVRAAVAVDGGSGLALLVEWSSDVDAAYSDVTVAAVLDPANESNWRELAGTVAAPRGATLGRVVGMGLTRGGSGRVRVDRFHLSEEGDAQRMTMAGPGGLELALDERGVLSLGRDKRELAGQIGLTLQRGDLLASQQAGRIEQPLAEQTDGSLLALSSVPLVTEGKRMDLAFVARPTTDGVRLRWSTPETPGALQVGFRVPHLADLGTVLLDGQPLPSPLPAEGYRKQGITEMAWGEGKRQVSFRFDAPATLDAAPLTRGVRLWFVVTPRPLATGELAIGMEVAAASLSAHADIQRLFREADDARAAGDYQRALRAYATLRSRYRHEQDVATRAARETAVVEQRAERLETFLSWTAEQARELQAPPLLDVARSALTELEAGFGESDQTRGGRKQLREVERAVEERRRAESADRVRHLLTLALRYRKAGQLRLARMTYAGIVEHFAEEVPGVTEAKGKLEAMR